MAILWPTGTLDQSRSTESLRRALHNAVTLADAGAGVLVLRDDSSQDPASDVPDDNIVVLAGIEREFAIQLITLLASDLSPQPLDGRPRVTSHSEVWGGEIASLQLGDLAGAVVEVHLLGPTGFTTRRMLASEMTRAAT